MDDTTTTKRFSTRVYEFGRSIGRILSGGQRDENMTIVQERYPSDDERKGKCREREREVIGNKN